jgi:hypothetical protein
LCAPSLQQRHQRDGHTAASAALARAPRRAAGPRRAAESRRPPPRCVYNLGDECHDADARIADLEARALLVCLTMRVPLIILAGKPKGAVGHLLKFDHILIEVMAKGSKL